MIGVRHLIDIFEFGVGMKNDAVGHFAAGLLLAERCQERLSSQFPA